MAPATGAADALSLDVAGQQLLAPPGHGAGVETEQFGDAAVTAVADLERLKCGVETALAFVEQGIEQDDGGAQLAGHNRPDRADGGSGRRRLVNVSGAQLGVVPLAVGREVDPAGADLGAPDATLDSELAQWILDLDVQQVLEFVGGVAGFGVGDQNGTGVDQGAVAGEADLVVGPQSELVEASDLVESVVLATVGITRQIAERAQLAEHGHGDLGTEGGLEFDQSEDGVYAEQLAQIVGGRGRGVMITLHDGATIT